MYIRLNNLKTSLFHIQFVCLYPADSGSKVKLKIKCSF